MIKYAPFLQNSTGSRQFHAVVIGSQCFSMVGKIPIMHYFASLWLHNVSAMISHSVYPHYTSLASLAAVQLLDLSSN